MRLGVLDLGSNTVHLLVVDAHSGARPIPAYSHKVEVRLSELMDGKGAIGRKGAEKLVEVVGEALEIAEDKGVEDFLAFATSAVREADNGDEVITRIREKTGADLAVLSGGDEARLTFLAVRRWFGWSAGRLLVLDIGGGSLEVASGGDEEPDAATSLPLGAGRLTREWLTGDPPDAHEVKALRKHVRAQVARSVGGIIRYGRPDLAVATSKTFRSLARVCGAAPSGDGMFVRRTLSRSDLAGRLDELAGMPASERARLPGVSASRSHQMVAGAVVADAALDLFEVPVVDICPWALREGVILRRLDWLSGVTDLDLGGNDPGV